MQLVAEKDFRLTLGYAFDERFVYEFELKNVTRRISKYNLIMPNYRLSNRLLNLTILSCFFLRKWTDHYKRYFEPPGNKVGYDFQNSSYIKDLLVLNEEKEKKIYFVPTRRLNFLQTSYFVYDRSSLIKPTFITGINNFLLIYCLVSNFLEKKIRQIKNNISCQTKTFSN